MSWLPQESSLHSGAMCIYILGHILQSLASVRLLLCQTVPLSDCSLLKWESAHFPFLFVLFIFCFILLQVHLEFHFERVFSSATTRSTVKVILLKTQQMLSSPPPPPPPPPPPAPPSSSRPQSQGQRAHCSLISSRSRRLSLAASRSQFNSQTMRNACACECVSDAWPQWMHRYKPQRHLSPLNQTPSAHFPLIPHWLNMT